MCLASVYSKEQSPDNLLLSNVQRIECNDNEITITDLLGRRVTVEGKITLVDLTDNIVMIRPE